MFRKKSKWSLRQKAFVLVVALLAILITVGYLASPASAGGGDDDGVPYITMTVTGVKPDFVSCALLRCSAAFTISPAGTGRTYIGYASGWNLKMERAYNLSGRFWDDGRVTRLKITG